MSHSYNKVWIHGIWATKEINPLITQAIEKKVFDFLSEQFREQGCPVRIINGMPDHVHCLFLLSAQKTVSDVIKQVKGSSSHFINQNGLVSEKFAWQTGYAAFSVSESGVEGVYEYIKNQKKYPQKRSFDEEQEGFFKPYQLES